MTLFPLELTTWVGLATHKHGVLPFSSAHLPSQISRRSVVIGLKESQSTKQRANHWCTMMPLLVVFKSVSFSQYVPRNDPSGLVVLQTNQLIAMKPNMTGKVTFCVCIYLVCVVKNGMRRNSRHKRFTKCFMLGYKLILSNNRPFIV